MNSGRPTDLLVVGGGPAGLAAAAEAAAEGLTVTVVDERPTLGGQIFKQPGPGFRITDTAAVGADFRRGRALIEAVERSAAEVLVRTSVVALEAMTVVLVTEGKRAERRDARRLLLAPGAYDRPVAFPGWTLPGVVTAGGAQALVKTQRVLPGRRIVFAGSGPLALAFPAQLRSYGANIIEVLDAGRAARPRDVAALLAAARGNVSILRDAVAYRAALLRARVPLRYARIVTQAEGDGRLEEVVHAAVDRDWRPVQGTEERVTADALCVGYGFSPSTELLRVAGCNFAYDENLGGPVVTLDEWQRTTVPGVFAAGDGAGVMGSYVAEDEGRLAAICAALELDALRPAEAERRALPIRRRLREKARLRRALERMHRIGPGLDELANPATVICRCEEVTAETLAPAVDATADINLVKMLTRAGMGLCQGRNCQRTVAAMIARRHGLEVGAVTASTPRSPVRPVPIAAVADASLEDDKFFTVDA